MKRRALVVILLIALGIVCWLGYRYLDPPLPDLNQVLAQLDLARQPGPASDLAATGFIEASRITVSSGVGGRISGLYVAEGDQLAVEQPLLDLEDSLIEAQAAQADAGIAQAQAQLDLLLAGARPEEIALARAQGVQAQAVEDAAWQAWQDAQLLRDNPQELDLRIIEVETASAKSGHQAAAARRLAEAADLEAALWGRVTERLRGGVDVTLPGGIVFHVDKPAEHAQANTQWNLAGQKAWQAWQAAYAAEEAAQGAYRSLADLRRQRENPIAADARVNQAESAYYQAEAAVEQAQAVLQRLEDGPTPEQIQVARRALEQARAARAALEVERDRLRIVAPQAGLVSAVAVQPGELAMPGMPLVEISDLSQVDLTVYVPEPELGRVWLGQQARVTVDSFPNRGFEGLVTHIADQAEFTPRNVQTQEERVSTVFAVSVSLPNPDGALKPGMPADAVFETPPGLPATGGLTQPGDPLQRLLDLWPAGSERGESSQTPSRPTSILASGTIEADETTVSAEVRGQVVAVLVDRGESIGAGQPLVRLDDALLQAQLREADTAVKTAQAHLAATLARPPRGEIRVAQAGLRQARASWNGAWQGLADAQRALQEPQALDARVHALETQVALAQRQVEQAQARRAAARVLSESIAGDGSDEGRTQRSVYEKQVEAADEEIGLAQAEAAGAQRALAAVRRMRQEPVELQAQVNAASAQLQMAAEAVRVAQAALHLAAAGPRPEAVALAEAQLSQAESLRGLLQVTAGKLVLASPVDGVVTARAINAGETALPGAPLLTLADLSRVTLIIYVPQPNIGYVSVGQQALARVDSYPGRAFAGTVVHIATEAEFTPSNIQTPEERVQTVFAVKIVLDNPDGALKPGMPADAEILVE